MIFTLLDLGHVDRVPLPVPALTRATYDRNTGWVNVRGFLGCWDGWGYRRKRHTSHGGFRCGYGQTLHRKGVACKVPEQEGDG
jgi:hypothetical protein